jgi:hypothetical protein
LITSPRFDTSTFADDDDQKADRPTAATSQLVMTMCLVEMSLSANLIFVM